MSKLVLRVMATAFCLSFSTLGSTQHDREWQNAPILAVEAAARDNDKRAQFELGWRYEQGIGVHKDLREARRWYKKASRTSVDRNYVYSGPIGNEKYGRAIEVGKPRVQPGGPPAAARLKALGSESDK